MNKYGFLQTSSPSGDSRKENVPMHNPLENVTAVNPKQRLAIQDPLQNFQIVFMGPEGSTIKERISGTNLMERKLWDILFIRNEYGWRPLHFAVLDYFCEKYNLVLSVSHHEYRLLDELTASEKHFYESILYGDWGHREVGAKRYIPHTHCQE